MIVFCDIHLALPVQFYIRFGWLRDSSQHLFVPVFIRLRWLGLGLGLGSGLFDNGFNADALPL